MEIEVCAVGGYSEVGKNMTAVRVDDEVVLLDMGFHLQKLTEYEEQGGSRLGLSHNRLMKLGVIPDTDVIDGWRSKVKAIALSHVHLDHIGAAPYLAKNYKTKIYGTPFTTEVLRETYKADDIQLQNHIETIETGKRIRISDNLELEFVHMTHSTPHCTFVLIHTKQGVIVYASDFKFDNNPVVGKLPDMARLKKLAHENVRAVIVNSLYSYDARKTPGEHVARDMLKEVMLGTDQERNAMIGTCFASHIARLRSFIDFGKKLGREVCIFGKSMRRYIMAAEKCGIVNFTKEAKVIGFSGMIRRKIKQMQKNGMENYLVLATGGQGEKEATLTKMLNGTYNFNIQKDDSFIFSNKVIPVSPNIQNRKKMEEQLLKHNARVFSNVHVSGHAGREDLRELIEMINPEVIIPFHGERKLLEPMGDLAEEMGYKHGRDVHILGDGKKIKL